MRERVTHRLGGRGAGVHINTFHSLCAALLREGGRAIGIEPGFAIGRSRELNRLIGGAIGRVRGAPPSLGPRDALRAVERHDRLSGDDNADIEPWEAELAEEYRSAQRREGELDFDGLVAEARRLLGEHPEALDAFIARGGQGLRLKHLLIDEFQDTNRVQYDVARLLAAGGAGVTAVGDPDQSIYSFRGGDAGNSARFLADFGAAREMKLTRTYRSTRRILGAARGVLGAGRASDGAPVSTGKAAGDAVTIWECADEREEGRLVAAAITAAMQADGRSYGDFAVLYRTGAQAAAAEAALAQAGIPARIVRRSDREGRREVTYFERSDVGEALALLRLAAKPNDAEALRAALPMAGSAADRACTAIAARARKDGVSLVVAASRVGSSRGQSARAAAGVSAAAAAGVAALDGAASDRRRVPDDPLAVTPYEGDEEMRGLMGPEAAEAGGGTAPPSAVLREVLGAGGAKHWLGATAQPDSREVLGQLVRRAAAFDTTPGRAGVLAFLGECDALRGAARGDAEAPSAVSLMTIHSAKGLEFPVAFIVGMEEELLPGYRKGASELIEERRVCYVAMTRAIDRLYPHVGARAHRREARGATTAQRVAVPRGHPGVGCHAVPRRRGDWPRRGAGVMCGACDAELAAFVAEAFTAKTAEPLDPAGDEAIDRLTAVLAPGVTVVGAATPTATRSRERIVVV